MTFRLICCLAALLIGACNDVSGSKEELTDYYHQTFQTHLAKQNSINDAPMVFLGDSLTESMPVSSVFENAINYGIKQDTTYGLLLRVQEYTALEKARGIVVAIGINDFWRGRTNRDLVSNIEKIIEALPENKLIIVYGLLPVDENQGWHGWNKRIVIVNQELEKSLNQKHVNFFDIGNELKGKDGNLAPKFHVGDGVHLSNDGYRVWLTHLKRAISQGN
ncbi:GDSL-type esterase/lipase family protein [Pleionea litopenaei]|uniref:GDSL-type esterase/lipase family protein n=1 Tax=Pleionea litopenaei TaxID=3070815 RepID=A0AA51RRA4_9GAMM|nr:GDSL-type esterase/lipase family protein [Pleionea sp. HL-JVS1]WMS86187.1 GDSL-type esterase/lipase family protein [Pleionea sp. HL-JVS1]